MKQRAKKGNDNIILNKEQIKLIIPHREPMLFVDEAVILEPGYSIKARLHIDERWEIFKGHFHKDGVFPGVLSIEAMAQAADIMLLCTEKYKGKLPLLISVEEVRLKRKIVPGDDISIKARVLNENHEKAIITCEAEIMNNTESAASGKFTLAMR